jgi:hypothetical protein
MDQLIQFLADSLGLEYATVEGSVATLFFLLFLFTLKLLYAASKRDDKQINLETTLADLAMNAVQSYQNNTQTIKEISEVLGGMKTSFNDLVSELKNVVIEVQNISDNNTKTGPVLEEIKANLIKTSKTVVVIKDAEDNILAKLTAEPDEEGQLVVRFNSTAEVDEQ